MFLKRIFKYFEPAWTGNDNKVSLRACLAIAFSVDFIRNLNYAVWKWEAGRSLEGLSLTLGIEAGLIVGLLGLTTYQNLQTFGRGDGTYYKQTTETSTKDTVQKVEGQPNSVETTD